MSRRKPARALVTRRNVGGRRAGAGRKPRAGVARDVGRSLWLTPGERDAQDAAAARAGASWSDWLRKLANAAAVPTPVESESTR